MVRYFNEDAPDGATHYYPVIGVYRYIFYKRKGERWYRWDSTLELWGLLTKRPHRAYEIHRGETA
ncbi:hypothetical protein VPH1254_0046 [Vibrio phage 1254]